jgi:acylphosphatase|tara:strand:+ start:327 stop:596 length:270 start_codon:yes stop_codon:yes gene_type:complete
MKRIHIIVKGSVQGVFFRSNTKETAIKLGLKGYVKNLDGGSVEIVAEGNEDEINELIEFCKKGPGSAQVEDVEIEFEKPKIEFKSFEIK